MGKDKEGVLRRGLMLRAGALVAIVAGTMVSSALLPLAFLSYVLAGYSWTFISVSSTAIVSERAGGEREKGSAMGTYNLVSSAGYVTGSALSGLLVSSAGFGAAFGLGLALLGGERGPAEKVKGRKIEKAKGGTGSGPRSELQDSRGL